MDVWKEMEKAATVFAGKTASYAKVSHLESKIDETKGEIEAAYKKLGMYILEKALPLDDEGASLQVSDIREKMAKIEEMKEKIAYIRAKKHCPECGTLYDEGEEFCKKCGAPLSADAMRRAAEEETDIRQENPAEEPAKED